MYRIMDSFGWFQNKFLSNLNRIQIFTIKQLTAFFLQNSFDTKFGRNFCFKIMEHVY